MEKTIPSFNDVTEDVGQPPHTVPQFIDMILGEQPLTPAQQQQAWEHLALCVHCQTFLAHYLYEVIAYNKDHGASEEQAQDLLKKLTVITHATLKQDIPAYVETLEKQNKAAADRRFPLFAAHLSTCRSCQLEVKYLSAWLRYESEAESSL